MDPTSAPLRVFSISPIDARDGLDEKLDRSYKTLKSLTTSTTSESEVHEALNSFVSRSDAAHEEVCVGLIVEILTDVTNCETNFKRLCLVNRDGMLVVVSTLNVIIVEKFWKLHDSCRGQILWLVTKFIGIKASRVDDILYNLLRNVAGGDVSPRNIAFAESMVDLVSSQPVKDWADEVKATPLIVYNLLRLVVDHANFPSLRQKEVKLAISLLREKFADCIPVGRDLVRVLQNVARIPEFEVFWRDLLQSPMSLSPNFSGVLQLLQMRTPRRFLSCLLTPDMEKKIAFLLSQVRFGQQKRYQEWFQKQYLSTPESHSLRSDLIRYICGCIHPSNEVLCSDIIPRWAVIGWILSSCTSNVAASSAKLSLFYDWLFYDAEKDNIMNIEPAILVMYQSMRSHPVITVTLLDFLCRILPNFCPQLTPHVRKGICTSLQQILEKKVIASLVPLFEGKKLDPELQALIKQTFPEFCSSHQIPPTSTEVMGLGDLKDLNHSNNNNNDDSNEARFSDDEDDSNNGKKKVTLNNGQSAKSRIKDEPPSKNEVTLSLDNLSSDMKKNLLSMISEKDVETRCELMEKVIEVVSGEDDFDNDMSNSLSIVLSSILHDDFKKKIFPVEGSPSSPEDSISSPFFVIVRTLSEMSEEDPSSRSPILSVLSDLSSRVSCVGYLILYYLKVSKASNYSLYKEFAKLSSKDLTSCLLSDLRTCQEDDVNMFCFILPDVYRNLESTVLSSPHFLRLTVSCIDAFQLQDLICHILQGDLKMVKKDNILQLINASLDWDTFEQNWLWQLILAHNVGVEAILPVLPKLEYHQHSEALTHILLSLRKQEPTSDLLKHILSREVKEDDFFALSILILWSKGHEKKLAEFLAGILKNSLTPTKRKRPNSQSKATSTSLSSTSEQILSHLEQLRQNGRVSPSFFNQESLQSVLTSIKSSCSESQAKRFSELFDLTDDESDGKGKGKKATSKKKAKTSDAESEDDSTSPKIKSNSRDKKKRKAVINDDSD